MASRGPELLKSVQVLVPLRVEVLEGGKRIAGQDTALG